MNEKALEKILNIFFKEVLPLTVKGVAKGNFELVYNSKKYLVPCERRFEINSENIVVGFVSNGCF